MTTPQRQLEAAALQSVFHVALSRLGARALVEALDAWEDVQPIPSRVQTSGTRWFTRVLELIGFRRSQARDMTRLYVRLVRGLRTGYTLALPEEPDETSLNDLRRPLLLLIEEVVPEVFDEVDWPTPAGNDSVEAEVVDGLEEDLGDLEDDAQEEFEVLADWLINTLSQKLSEIDDEQPASQVDAQREEVKEQVGSRSASVAERLVMNAGRDTLLVTQAKDKRAIAYVRVHNGTDVLCGWCAMLLSRGAVYRNKESAETVGRNRKGTREDGETFHDNCHCVGEAIYTDEQYDEPAFDANRELRLAWAKVTDGLSGKEALTEWRRYMRQKAASARRAA